MAPPGGAGLRASVVIPAFNAQDTIYETVLSARKQSLRDIEIIVVDDGSRDRTSQIVEEIAKLDHRVSLHRQPNAGVAAARNAGIALSHGPYIAFLDADDLWAPDKLARQIAAIEAGGPSCGFSYTFQTAIDGADAVLWSAVGREVSGPALAALLEDDFIGSGSNVVARAELVRACGGFSSELRAAGAQGSEDWQLALRLAELGTIACVPDILLAYRRTRGNMSGQAAQMLRSAELVATSYRARFPEYASRIDSYLAERRRWLVARAVADLNLEQVAALAAKIGLGQTLRLAVSMAGPVMRETVSRVLRRLRLRRTSYFSV